MYKVLATDEMANLMEELGKAKCGESDSEGDELIC